MFDGLSDRVGDILSDRVCGSVSGSCGAEPVATVDGCG